MGQGSISNLSLRHEMRTDAGYNYESGQWVPIGDVRPASVPPKSPCITRVGAPFTRFQSGGSVTDLQFLARVHVRGLS